MLFRSLGCDAVVMVASRIGNDALYHALNARAADWADAGIRSVKLIGDAAAPAPIAWATFAGHRYARELDAPDIGDALPFRREVTALAADFDGELWIGTDAGFAVLYNANGSFAAGAGNYDAQRILIPFEGNYEEVLGDASITDIEVDGGNRKWISLANAGLVLLSSDGTQIIAQYTEDNSPLISNTIYDIEINQQTGELYIVTDKGLVSFRIDATYEDPSYETLNVFPNPVKPDYFGPITIQGIRYNSDVKVTDAAGNLIYKTLSNGGTATWNGQNLNGEKVPTGVYFFWTANNYQGGERKVAKVLVIR